MKSQTINEGSQSTEEKIKGAAAKVFVRRGFAATKTRDIADEAGINIASLHYYFRSKDKLFEIVIGDALKKFSIIMDEIFSSDMDLQEKIKSFVSRYIDFFKENPYIPLFIISESQANPDKVDKILDGQKSIDGLKEQLKNLSDQGIIRPIHHAHFMMNLVSMTVFPFISKPILMKKTKLSSEVYDRLLEERKEIIPEMIINYLYIKNLE